MTLTARMPDMAGWRLREHLERMLAQQWMPGAGSASVPAPVAAERWAAHLCVMVVDDDELNLLIASEMLRSWGVNALIAQDGGEAAAMAGQLKLNLILMDLQMPFVDGAAATRAIRRQESACGRRRVPVIAFTSSQPSTADLRAWDMDGRLDKPCDPDALRDCLLQWCPWLRGARPADRQTTGRTHWAALAGGRHARR